MNWFQSISRVILHGSRRPTEVARVRVVVGAWLLVLMTALMVFDHGTAWAWPLAAVAILHFGLAYNAFHSHGRRA